MFAEGHEITLTDVMLYSCYTIIVKLLPKSQSLRDHLPLTFAWMEAVRKELEKSDILEVEPELHSSAVDFSDIYYKINKMTDYSLYKNNAKRYKPKNEIYTKQSDIDESLSKINSFNLPISSADGDYITDTFDWDCLPYDALPEGGHLPDKRLLRKKHQLQSLSMEIIRMAKEGDRIVDFCSGSGHLGIIVAYKLPQCQVILLENKEESLMRAKKRVDKLGLNNILFLQCNLDYFQGKFNIGTSLHACGVATDIVLLLCQQQLANFVCCPCCYGGIHQIPHITYPKSNFFQNIVKLNFRDCMQLAHCADQAHDIRIEKCNIKKSAQGQYCMDIVDWDRKLCAEEYGYVVRLTRLYPEDCTPKNRLLVGTYENSI